MERSSIYGLCSGSVMALLAAAASVNAQAQGQVAAPECVQDMQATERFIPVELLTGNPLPEKPELTFAPVKRVYPFIDASPDRSGDIKETSLEGPMSWTGEGGKVYEVYERKVPRAHERFALTADRTAIGRVYDERWGNATNEGKFPVGVWQQGQRRTYNTVYHTAQRDAALTSSVEIEKLSCTYEGVDGALQYRWKTSRGLDYSYIYAPGRGLVQVVTYRRGR
ncbi:hypothetical protein [Paenacidovorax monticola]|uniref:Uncharacterized protein n=1 Tax=Paenacidovorax monticola TaxID=1926868 RepID=A0A7H0HIR9_9BURK|nr:hypothetical protein [Paenacidovorax monticola]QNP60435.1 hypothetical protein H9L24_06165 [Paenacidovorax monticola]